MKKNKPKHYLFVIGTLNVGGAENYCKRMCKAIQNIPTHKAYIFPLIPDYSEEDKNLVVPSENLLKESNFKCLSTLNKAIYFLKRFISFVIVLYKYQITDIFAFLPFSNLFVTPSKFFKPSISYHYFRRSLAGYKYNKLYIHTEKLSFLLAKSIVANSKAVEFELRNEILSYYPSIISKIICRRLVVIHNGVKIPENPKKSYNLKDNTLCIVYCANFIAYKNQLFLLHVARKLSQRLPESQIKIKFLGNPSNEEYFNECLLMAKSLNSYFTTEFIVGVTEIYPVLRDSDIYVHASTQEGFSNAILEAMACAMPTIASKVGGTPDCINHGIDGYLFESNSAESLLTLLLDCHQDIKKRIEFGINARNKVIQKYSLQTSLKALLKL